MRGHQLLSSTLCVLASAPLPLLAMPWAEVGDRQLRDDIQLLHDTGLISGPILSWPLPWDQIADDISDARTAATISPFLRAAAQRVYLRMAHPKRLGLTPDIELKLRAATGEALVKDFADAARSQASVQLRASHQFDRLGLVYGAGVQQSQRYQGKSFGSRLTFDNLYATGQLGNWLVYAGTVEQWWGPSAEQSVIMSNSARPYPKIGLKRVRAEAFDLPLLRWLGPWRAEAQLGLLNGPRGDYSNVLLLSQRLEVQPSRHFQMALSRYAQICGTDSPFGLPDRRCSFGTIAKSLVLTPSANTGDVRTDSSNSGANIDMRYARPVGNVVVAAFVHLYAEDSIFTATSQMAGISVSGHSEGLGTWTVGAEAADTLALRTHDFAFGTRSPVVTYLNAVYSDGYSHRGKPIAFSLDGDARLVSLHGALTTRRNWRWSGALRFADINLRSSPRYRISDTREKIVQGEAKLSLPTRFGDLDVALRGQSDSPDTPGRRVPRAQAEAGLTIRF